MIDRRLTLELLRLAVKEKLLGAHDREWMPHHWDHLELMIHNVHEDLKAKGIKIDPPASDRRTFKGFLNKSAAEIHALRKNSSRAGKPFDLNMDYLVRILDLGLDGILAFEQCMHALDMHPDKVQETGSSILELVLAHRKPTATPASNGTKSAKTVNATMGRDPFATGTSAMEGDEVDFELPDGGLGEVNDAENTTEPFLAIAKPRRIRWILMGLMLVLGFAAYFSWPLLHPAPPDLAPAKPVIDIQTSGHNSPVIYNRQGDVLFFGNVSSPADSIQDTAIHP